MADRNDERSSPRAGEESGVSTLVDFSSFREMIQEEGEADRAEREAAAAEARMERERSAAEQRRLMAEVCELKLRLAEERRSRPGAVQSDTAAVQSGTIAGDDCITNIGGTTIGLNDRMHIEPMRWIGSESAPSPSRSRASTSSRNGDSGAVPVQRGNGETTVKQIKYVPLFDGIKAKFPAWKQNFLRLA